MKNLIIILLGILFLLSCQTNTVTDKPLDYRIVAEEDYSYVGTPRMKNRVVLEVDSLPTEEQLKITAKTIWLNGNKHWKEFTVFMYLPEMETDFVAFSMAEYNPDGLKDFWINKKALFGTKWEIKEKEKETVKHIPASEMKDYSIGISAKDLGNRKTKIVINTNFPDGTNLLIDVSRIYYLKATEDAYAGDIFSEDISVKQGKIELSVDINDSGWYNEHLRLVKALPNDIKPIRDISDNIEISALYSSARDQINEIKMILGEKGEYVSGQGVKKYKNLTTLRVEKELRNIPFKK